MVSEGGTGFRCLQNSLPNPDAVWWGEVELLAGADVECRIPWVEVADGGGAVLRGGVAVGDHLLAERGFALLFSPILSEGKEELLVGGKAVLCGGGLARERGAVAVVSGGEAGNVSDVFSQRLIAVQGNVGKGFVGVVLGGEPGGGRVEVREVGGRPPIADAAFGVEGAALVVKGMADFVAMMAPMPP